MKLNQLLARHHTFKFSNYSPLFYWLQKNLNFTFIIVWIWIALIPKVVHAKTNSYKFNRPTESSFSEWWIGNEYQRYRFMPPENLPPTVQDNDGNFSESIFAKLFGANPPKTRGCENTTLNDNQQKIASCLALVTEKNPQFNDLCADKYWRPGRSWTCAKSVAEAALKSHQTSSYATGCRASEKARDILNKESLIVDLIPHLREVAGGPLRGSEVYSDSVLKATRMVPPGSIISFTGNNRNRRNPKRNCPGPQGMGHMTVKTILEEKSLYGKTFLEQFCHFTCDDCAAVHHRFLDTILVRIKSEYRDYFQGPIAIEKICDDIFKNKGSVPPSKPAVR